MTSTRATRLTAVLSGLAAMIASVALVAVPQAAHAALPPECSSTAANVYRWTGGGSSGSWDDGNNWAHGPSNAPGVPNDGSFAPSAVVCIGPGASVFLDSAGLRFIELAALQLDGVALEIRAGAGLFVNGTTASAWGGGTVVTVASGTIGGRAVIDLHGEIDVTGPAILGSANRQPGASYGDTPGRLLIEPDGVLKVTGGLSMTTRDQLDVYGLLQLEPGGFIAADYGTSTTIRSGGRFLVNGDGGYYRGYAINLMVPSVVTNAGTLGKIAGTGASVVDATYVQGATGQVVVSCCGTLAMPDKTLVAALISPGMGLATGACPLQATTLCSPSVNPATDPMSVDFDVPGTNPQPAAVQLQELPTVTPVQDSKAIGNEALAHADLLTPDAAHPATLTLRYSQADVMATPLNEVQVAHTDDSGHQTQIPDCLSGALPAGVASCIVRPVTRTSQNTFVTVLTTQTSRWHLRRNKPGEPGDQTAPSTVQGLGVEKAAQPYDGSRVKVTWTAPLTDGGAAVTAYRVYLDGALAVTTTKSPAIVPNPGPGLHQLKVTAVNIIGEGAAVAGTIKLAKLSKPRGVKAVLGAKGGKLSAGATWKRPKDSGGLVLKGYQVVVFKRNVGKVDKGKVGAAKLRLLFRLKKGTYRFKVRARNAGGYGPWSAWTDWVSPR